MSSVLCCGSCSDASSNSLHFCFWIYQISPRKTTFWTTLTKRKWYVMNDAEQWWMKWYMIDDISRTEPKTTCSEKILKIKWLLHSVHWGINPTSNPPTNFLPSYPLNLQTVQVSLTLFRQSPPPPIYWFFVKPPSKTRIFPWTPTPNLLKFFIFTPSYLLKVTKFLVKLSQFEFLEKIQRILVYRLFLSLNIPDFSLFFVEILQPPMKKVTPLFPSNPPLHSNLKPSTSRQVLGNDIKRICWFCLNVVASLQRALIVDPVIKTSLLKKHHHHVKMGFIVGDIVTDSI